MHLIERAPRTYRHRGYLMAALNAGPYRWNVWRPDEDLAFCGVRSLAEAQEEIEADLSEVG